MSGDPAAHLVIVGLSHRNVPAGVRETLFVEDVDRARLLADLRAAGFEQGVVLATCERVEVATLSETPNKVELTAARLLADWSGMDGEEVGRLLSIHRGHAALRHLFAVAAALDSQMLGEPQVLGQLKDSHRVAQEAGLVAGRLEAMLQSAYTVAKRVRSETELASQPVSIAAAAIKVARQIHGDLRRCNALMLGLGEMGELMAAQLRDSAVARLVLAHPTQRRAETAARRLACDVRPWEDLDAALVDADIVVAGLGRGDYVLGRQTVRRALKRRRQRPIFIMDAAVPADVEPKVHDLDSAFVYDLGDLERVAQEGRVQREHAALDAWAIVDAELDAFAKRAAGREAVPSVTGLRQHFETVRAEVLATGKLDAEAATRLLVNRLLHGPTQALREAAGDVETRAELERSLARLYGIDPREGGQSEDDADDAQR
ncbi:glutamyl-tRNA reductase [Rhodovibrio salinarum]|uniref:Glutamyl-tRNA reductase n=1 Tax=Rhodovibrio salinarum TaxID=1087 RepID=A0A934V022_9PROT|nr:glutamyl-tRNA reductase [Rhodovibrio salinarum]MBK1697136.1 glutamyl-tRNA reductase [Rhodovibrio salinarum]